MDSVPLVPLSVLFGNPVFSSAQVSPDGRYISFLKPSPDKDVLNVWVRERLPPSSGDEAAAVAGGDAADRVCKQQQQGKQQQRRVADRMVTSDTYRGIRTYVWAGQHILYLQDKDGDEDWHLYCQPLQPGRPAKCLTPFKGVRCENLLTDPGHPSTVLAGLNRRDRRCFDVWRVDIETGELSLEVENPGDVLSWYADGAFAVRGALSMNPEDGSKTLRVRDARSSWFDLVTWPQDEEGQVVGFNEDGSGVFVTSSLGRDTTELQLLDASAPPPGGPSAPRVLERLAASPACDVAQVLWDRLQRRPLAVRFDYLRREWKVLDLSVGPDFSQLLDAAAAASSDLQVDSWSDGGGVWVVSLVRDDGPLEFYCYDRTQAAEGVPGSLQPLFVDRPDLKAYKLGRRHPVLLTARDGVTLPSYLTLPPLPSCPSELLQPDPAAGQPCWQQLEGLQLPLVVLPHGGPWFRDNWALDPSAQWMANRGYAVLQVNFRGSTGFGKRFLHLGDGQWGVGSMQHDLSDAVAWATSGSGFADPGRVAISGGSYGGYACLAGLAFTPELYCCGVDVVGPSHIRTLLATVPAYWAPLKRMLLQRIGDAEADEEFNRRISPFYHAASIRAPLIIAQGLNDPRVKKAESDQIFSALRDRGVQAEYYVYTEEGHGFARPANRLDFYSRADRFLARHLGSRAEPPLRPKGCAVVAMHLLDSLDDFTAGEGRGESALEERETAAPGRARLLRRLGIALGVPAAVLCGGAALVVSVLRGLSPRR